MFVLGLVTGFGISLFIYQIYVFYLEKQKNKEAKEIFNVMIDLYKSEKNIEGVGLDVNRKTKK